MDACYRLLAPLVLLITPLYGAFILCCLPVYSLSTQQLCCIQHLLQPSFAVDSSNGHCQCKHFIFVTYLLWPLHASARVHAFHGWQEV